MRDTKDPAPTIVVGVDGSPRSEDAVNFAGRLAGATEARIALVFAYPNVAFDTAYGAPSIEEPLRTEAAATLRRFRDLLPDGVEATTHVTAAPSPARALHDMAVRHGASLLILGSSHVGRLGRITPGSTAERLLHGAPCPLMVVPAGMARRTDGAAGPIGVAYDGSAESRIALGAAVAAAPALSVPLRVIGVCDVSRYSAPALQFGPGYYVSADTLRDDAAVQLAAAVAELPGDVAAEQVLRVGSPAPELADASSELGMLFVGSRGYGPLRAVLLGGVSGALIRDAACPVIVTPRGAAVDTPTAIAAAAAR